MQVRHIKTGEVCEMIRVVKIKQDVFTTELSLQEWQDGIEYEKDGNIYVRELYDFFMNFEPILRGVKDMPTVINEVLGEPESGKLYTPSTKWQTIS